MSSEIGKVHSLWRYPVKSMLGERLEAAEVTGRGIFGDRSYAVVDAASGRVASAKSPRKWSKLLDLRAALDLSIDDGGIPPVRITLPDGAELSSEQDDFDRLLSEECGREVSLRGAASEALSFTYEYDQSDEKGLSGEEAVTEEAMPDGTFFDDAVLHLLTTSSLARLGKLRPQGHFEAPRFRPNVLLELDDGEEGFFEEAWLGRTLCIGSEARMHITTPCVRCVMVNLPQGRLPKDPGILRAVAEHNASKVGVYASVRRGGRISAGDRIMLD